VAQFEIVILSKPPLRSEGSERAAPCRGPHQARFWPDGVDDAARSLRRHDRAFGSLPFNFKLSHYPNSPLPKFPSWEPTLILYGVLWRNPARGQQDILCQREIGATSYVCNAGVCGGDVMDYQFWIRELFADAEAKNKAHVVAALDPHQLRSIYTQGIPPSVEELISRQAAISSEELKSRWV